MSIEKKLDLILAHLGIEYIHGKGEKRGTKWKYLNPAPGEFINYPENWSLHKAAEEFAKFQDYWLSVPGQKGVKKDWLATWRNWCRA